MEQLQNFKEEGINWNLIIMIILAVALVIALAFIFGKPAFDNYIQETQLQAQQDLLNLILASVQQRGYVDIPIGNETIRLVAQTK